MYISDPNKIPTMVNTQSCARIFGVSRTTIEKWAKSGKLIPDKLVGGRKMYSKKLLLDFLGIAYEEKPVVIVTKAKIIRHNEQATSTH